MTRLPDLRAYLDALESLGDLRRVNREVDADLEAAAMTRLSYERRAPAPLFERVSEVAPGFRLFGAPIGISSAPGMPLARIALSIGMPPDATASDLIERLLHAQSLPAVPPSPVPAEKAACKENVLLRDDATLESFPIPRVHEHDGGRYANTFGVVVASTPDGSWTNWSIARIMMLDGRRMTGLVLPSQHIGQVWQEWVKIGEPMPYALVQGGNPGVPFVGGIPLPARVNEADYLGALYGESVEVTRCETSDLYVPASAEVVIEGHVSTERAAVEGPFGEYAGYMPTHTSEQPIFSVEAITHRDDPIWPLVAEGRPVDETHTVTGTGRAVALLGELRAAGLPITTVWTPLQSANHWTVITVPAGWRETLPGLDTHEFAHRIGKVIDVSRILPVSVFVLDDDIDPSNEAELSWALATRIHPHYGAEPWFRTILPLMNSYSDREKALAHGPMVVHDGLQPAPGAGRPVHSSFAQAYPPEIRQRVLAHWLD